MAPSILIVGATGNTGKALLTTLPSLLESSSTLTSHQILALTRSASSASSQSLAKLPGIQLIEKDWTHIDADWLREHSVSRVFIAPHIEPSAFADESGLLVEMLDAEVEYVVRVSTTGANISPTSKVTHTRMHWAIENLLAQKEFEGLMWTSLQPNIFTSMALGPAIAWIKQYRETGKQEPLKTIFAPDAKVAMIANDEVGVIAAHLLALDDVSPHNHAKYALSGPKDITGEQIVELMEQVIGEKIQDMRFQDLSFFDHLAEMGFAPNRVAAMKHALEVLWDGECSSAGMPTSERVSELAAPKIAPAEAFAAML